MIGTCTICPEKLCNRALGQNLTIGILVYLAACLYVVNVRTLGNDVVNDSCINGCNITENHKYG